MKDLALLVILTIYSVRTHITRYFIMFTNSISNRVKHFQFHHDLKSLLSVTSKCLMKRPLAPSHASPQPPFLSNGLSIDRTSESIQVTFSTPSVHLPSPLCPH